jgi:hypothetical protein
MGEGHVSVPRHLDHVLVGVGDFFAGLLGGGIETGGQGVQSLASSSSVVKPPSLRVLKPLFAVKPQLSPLTDRNNLVKSIARIVEEIMSTIN